MWARFRTHFKGFPAQEKVAQIMVLYGLRVHEGHVFCGDIKVSDTAMARATGVDRRVGTATVAPRESVGRGLKLADRGGRSGRRGSPRAKGWGAG